jgi:hypothetical protein
MTCADEAIASHVLAVDHRLEKEAVLGVLCYPQVRHARCEEIRREFDIDRDTVSLLLDVNEALDGLEGGQGRKSLEGALH